MPAIMNQISKAIKVSEIRFNPVVVSSETAITLTMAELNLISDTFMAFEIWFIIAGIYLALTITLSIGVGQLEKKLNVASSSNRS